MNKKTFGAVESYETPAVNVIDLQVEGVLCASGDFGVNDWGYDEDEDRELDF